ncbi:MAG: biotin synthase BioB [Deferribacterota bacterium]|nr:biotin synthase BioB [Deferribacterota bacterium]
MNIFLEAAENIIENNITLEKEFLLEFFTHKPLDDILIASDTLRHHYLKNKIHMCSVLNIKSGLCNMDCKFCAQSSISHASIEKYPLLPNNEIETFIEANKTNSVGRLGLVSSGKKLSKNEINRLAELIKSIKTTKGLCISPGDMDLEDMLLLKESGITRYHHNLETSMRFYPEISSKIDYRSKINTIKKAKQAGLAVCSGGIFGIGEKDEDIIELAILLKELDVDSIPLNFLMPIENTPLEDYNLLTPDRCLRIIAVFRFILPKKDILICGGRMENLKDMHKYIYKAGASGILTGNYLTTKGRSLSDDNKTIREMGLEPRDIQFIAGSGLNSEGRIVS